MVLGTDGTEKRIGALVAAEALIIAVSCAYGASVLPRHSQAACAVYVAFCALGCAAAAVLWYVFVARRPVFWGRRATPARLVAALVVSVVVAVLVELGTLVGAPLSSPSNPDDWHVSRIAAFFAMSLPFACCVVMYDWRAAARRMRDAALANGARLAKRTAAYAAASVCAGTAAALVFGALAESANVGNPSACRLFAGVVAALVVVLVGLRHSMADAPERGLFAVLLAAGFLFAVLTPWYTHVSWDDHIHYDRAVAASYLIDPEYTSADAALVGKAFHDVAYFSRDRDDAGRVNAYDENRLHDRYHQIDELGYAGKRAASEGQAAGAQAGGAASGAEHDAKAASAEDSSGDSGVGNSGVSADEDADANANANANASADKTDNDDERKLLALGTPPDIPALSDLGPGAHLFDGSEPQAVRLDGAVTLRGVGIIEYYTVAYLPAALGLWTARLLSLPASAAFLAGRLFTMVSFALLAYFACKRLKSGKMFLAACALVPTLVFLASNYSYDSWLAGFLMLGFSIFAGELQRPDEPLRWRWFLLMIAAFLVGLGPKAVYVPVAALLLFMPRAKFAKRTRASGAGRAALGEKRTMRGKISSAHAEEGATANKSLPNKGGGSSVVPQLTQGRYLAVVFASAAFVLATFVLPLLFAGPGAGDVRGGDVNPAVQIAFIANQSLGYLVVFLKFCAYFFTMGNVPFILTDFCGVETSGYAYAVMALLVAVALTDRAACDAPFATHAKRITMFALFALTFFLICTALFISFTPAGWDWICGVQGRYLLPLLFPVGLICLNFRPLCRLGANIKAARLGRATYHYAVLLLGGFFVLASIAETIVFNA